MSQELLCRIAMPADDTGCCTSHPTIAEQMGMKPDPNKLEHGFHGGVHLTKVYTSGGHGVDSDQPGFPVYHRRIAK